LYSGGKGGEGETMMVSEIGRRGGGNAEKKKERKSTKRVEGETRSIL